MDEESTADEKEPFEYFDKGSMATISRYSAVMQVPIPGIKKTFETEEYQQFNEQNSLTPLEIPGDEVVAMLEEDRQRYADLIEEYGIDLGDAS